MSRLQNAHLDSHFARITQEHILGLEAGCLCMYCYRHQLLASPSKLPQLQIPQRGIHQCSPCETNVVAKVPAIIADSQ